MLDIEVYSEGICYMSVCSTLSPEETVKQVQETRPSGTSHGWQLADETFRTGEPNGCACKDHKGRRHFLLCC